MRRESQSPITAPNPDFHPIKKGIPNKKPFLFVNNWPEKGSKGKDQ
jgi:hypothetical protein